MDKEFNVGILGCGQIAQIMHIPYIHSIPGLNVYSLCDISLEVAKKVANKYCVPEERVYTDYDKFLKDSNLDVVLICSKDHCEPVIKAANAGKHIFVEKPFGFNVEEAEKMVEAAEKNNVKLMVGYMKRYDSGFEEMLNNIKSMDSINMVRVHDFGGSFAHTRKVYDVLSGNDVSKEVFDKGKDATNAAMLNEVGQDNMEFFPAYSLLLGVSCHDSILLRHAFGNNPEVLYANVYQNSFLTAILKYGDIECVFESGLVMDREIWDENFEVFSGKKIIKLQFPWPYLKNAPSTLNISDTVPGTQMTRESVVTTSYHEAYRNEWIHFLNCLRTGDEPLTNGKDALNDIKLMSKIIRVAIDSNKIHKRG